MQELVELRRDYLIDLREIVERLREQGRHLADPQQFRTAFPELLFITHQLKGSGGTLGFPAITDVARRISNGLNLFLDESQPSRPSPEALSREVLALSDELERAVDSAACPDVS